jgi:hypothetical protein
MTRTTVEIAKLVLENEVLRDESEVLKKLNTNLLKSLSSIVNLDIQKADNQSKMASIAKNALRGEYDEL